MTSSLESRLADELYHWCVARGAPVARARCYAARGQLAYAPIEDWLKTKFAKGLREPLLPGRMLALLFEKQSLRTRVSFESGMVHLGGSSIMVTTESAWRCRLLSSSIL